MVAVMAMNGVAMDSELRGQAIKRSATSAQQLNPPAILVFANLATVVGALHATILAAKICSEQTALFGLRMDAKR
jgi:hypothetical protein